MASCGISLNLSSLEGSITGHISTALGFAGMSGIPFMPLAIKVAMAASNGNLFGAIKLMVPSGAFDGLLEGFRTDIGKLVGLDGKDGWGAALAETTGKWGDSIAGFAKDTGLDQLSGFVDINVTDLAKSAIGLGTSFDACDFGTGGIQNFFKDPSTGTIKLLANYAPKLGDTSQAAGNNVLGLALELNTAFQSGKFKNALDLNVQLGNVISSGTNYALDSINGAVDIDSRDLNNIKQYLGGQTLPGPLQRMTKSSTGVRQLTDKTHLTNNVHAKVIGRFPLASGGVNDGLVAAIDFAI
jgi:hypothetical protein